MTTFANATHPITVTSVYTPEEYAVIERFLNEQRAIMQTKYDGAKDDFRLQRYGTTLDVIDRLLTVASRQSVSL